MRKLKPVKIYPYYKKRILFDILFLMINIGFTSAQPPVTKEYQLKSVFLFHFSSFIEWPSSAYNELQSPFVIGILGENPFSTYLDATVAGEKVMERAVTVRQFVSVDDIENCQILFINFKGDSLIRKTVSLLNNRPVLTVSDAKNFTSLGGMIAFATVSNKIRLHINVVAARNAGLIISSKLLRLAEIHH